MPAGGSDPSSYSGIYSGTPSAPPAPSAPSAPTGGAYGYWGGPTTAWGASPYAGGAPPPPAPPSYYGDSFLQPTAPTAAQIAALGAEGRYTGPVYTPAAPPAPPTPPTTPAPVSLPTPTFDTTTQEGRHATEWYSQQSVEVQQAVAAERAGKATEEQSAMVTEAV